MVDDPWPPGRLRRAAFSVPLALLLALAIVIATPGPTPRDSQAQVRAAAALAFESLASGDLIGLDEHLAAHRGQSDFAYHFTVLTTPRILGDALGQVASVANDGSLGPDIDPHTYDLALTDLAGTLSLASYGAGDRALSSSWADDFILAMTSAEAEGDGEADGVTQRLDQDEANKQNLLLLLSRGYWSVSFLKKATTAFIEHDRAESGDAWPGVINGARYAPAPGGTFLTDGILALNAAMTANPAASRWAYTEFLPGMEEIEGTDYQVGAFTHYLLFDHQFPEVDGKSIGMTAVLTSLSAAIDAGGGPTRGQSNGVLDDTYVDSLVLQALAQDVRGADGECSFNPLSYVECAKAVVGTVWRWVQDWGHLVLDILSFASFAPPPFTIVGVVAAAGNATWYAIEGDYVMAGLSLATAVPGLTFQKVVKAVRAGRSAEKAAAQSEEIADVGLRLQGGARIAKERELAEASASRINKSPRPGFEREADAQTDIASKLPGSSTEKTFDPQCSATCAGKRRVDIFDAKRGRCIEVKKGVGTTNFKAHDRYEVAKDVLLRANGECKTVEWHFLPDLVGNVGPHEALRVLLQEKGIPFQMYLP